MSKNKHMHFSIMPMYAFVLIMFDCATISFDHVALVTYGYLQTQFPTPSKTSSPWSKSRNAPARVNPAWPNTFLMYVPCALPKTYVQAKCWARHSQSRLHLWRVTAPKESRRGAPEDSSANHEPQTPIPVWVSH
ncbi:hypothetical protein B0J13DRAFT_523987 [Dactylonectria estremocensis]|uniref:Uncharacterized protein n=1 Tax=Dactylonectria estremocensis TaxID=1079267 RepID=A0A9P9J4A0_9HYPO|nr:hypothetical protein B0J13DRAFT_523987 [Dactylonectria estremocensis]